MLGGGGGLTDREFIRRTNNSKFQQRGRQGNRAHIGEELGVEGVEVEQPRAVLPISCRRGCRLWFECPRPPPVPHLREIGLPEFTIVIYLCYNSEGG